MYLWYAKDETTFEQYGIYEKEPKWMHEHTWSGYNTHAGVGCYTWEGGSSSSYVMLVNQQRTVEMWWRDANSTGEKTDAHPLSTWTRGENAAMTPSTKCS